jgi:replicative DNA helicase
MEIPLSKDAEEAVLCCCIIDDSNDSFHQISKDVSAEDFYYDDHKIIWDTMADLAEANSTIDVVTLTEALQGEHEDIMLVPMNLSSVVSTTVSLKSYVKILKKKARLRAMRQQFKQGLELINKDSEPDLIEEQIEKELERHRPIPEETTHISNSLEIIKKEVSDMMSGEYKPEYVKTHLKHLDEKIKLELGTVFTIAAPTSVGKSALALNIAMKSSARDNKHSLIFSLEMPQKQLSKRMVSALSWTNFRQVEEAVASQEKVAKIHEAIEKLTNMPIDTIHTVRSVAQISADVKRFVKEKDTKLVVIDYLQLIPFNAGRMGKSDGIAMISQKIKQIALENNVCIVLLSQLNREGARSEFPDLYHLKDSGSIENDADTVLIMNCKDNDTEAAKATDSYGPYIHVNYLVAKNREGERGVRGHFKFYATYGLFF